MLRAKNMALYSLFLALCSLFLYGCSPPADYYHQVEDMEEQGEQIRSETGRRPGEIVVPITDPTPIRMPETSAQQAGSGRPQPDVKETPVVEQTAGFQERPPQREIVREPEPPSGPEPVAVASNVIKDALNASDLEVSVRTVELVNGRLSGGKNSVRIYFIPGSVDVIDDRFGAICAVVYYLNSQTKTVDTVAGIAEDEQSILLAILQSSISDITAWMTGDITRTEWHSKITKKIL